MVLIKWVGRPIMEGSSGGDFCGKGTGVRRAVRRRDR